MWEKRGWSDYKVSNKSLRLKYVRHVTGETEGMFGWEKGRGRKEERGREATFKGQRKGLFCVSIFSPSATVDNCSWKDTQEKETSPCLTNFGKIYATFGLTLAVFFPTPPIMSALLDKGHKMVAGGKYLASAHMHYYEHTQHKKSGLKRCFSASSSLHGCSGCL